MSNDASRIVIVDPRVMLLIVASLTDDSRCPSYDPSGIIYDDYSADITYYNHHMNSHNKFIVQVTVVTSATKTEKFF